MTITGNTLRDVAKYVDACNHDCPDIHTVTLTVNGNHGGVDVKVEGTQDEELGEFINLTDFTRTFEVH